jgi:hypothetical protein
VVDRERGRRKGGKSLEVVWEGGLWREGILRRLRLHGELLVLEGDDVRV